MELVTDYHIPDNRVVSGSPETRATVNLEAIRVLRECERDSRTPTTAECDTLAGYVGWGACPQIFAARIPEWKAANDTLRGLLTPGEYEYAEQSTLNAHYTSDLIVDAVWRAVTRLGATANLSWLEPAIGTGNFFGRQPSKLLNGAKRFGVEKDVVTGRIAQLLYPNANIEIAPFEQCEYPPNCFDCVVSNVPFGKYGVSDPQYDRNRPFLTKSIHNYFIAKSIEVTRPGGLVAVITSRYTMDGYESGHTKAREYISKQAELLGAVRLPSSAFKQSAGTDVVTDILFFQKRLPNVEPNEIAWAESVYRAIGNGSWASGGWCQNVNEYFNERPEQILGQEAFTSGMYGSREYAVKGELTSDLLNAALDRALPADVLQPYTPGQESTKVQLSGLQPGANKIGGLFIDGTRLFRRVSNGSAEEVASTPKAIQRVCGQLQIRDALLALLDAERTDTSDIESWRTELNQRYDSYVYGKSGHGPLNGRENAKAMSGDPDAPLLLSLERNYNERTASADKAPIFTQRVIMPACSVEQVDSAKDALTVSLNELGQICFERMSKLTGKTQEELESELIGLVYRDPSTKEWEPAEEYLSGAVRTKLKAARAFARIDDSFAANVAALESVQPDDIPPSQINAGLGVTWVPLDVYGEFAKHVMNLGYAPTVRYINGEFLFEVPRYYAREVTRWSTARVSAGTLLLDAMNLRRTKVYDEIENKPVLNKDATLAAREKQKELNTYFNEWLFEDSRSDTVTRIYNEQINNLRLRTFDGSHLTLPGMSRAGLRSGDLESYQKAAVWRQICQKNVYLAHAVGAGKTFEMIAGAMELQRLGQISRPMFVVPNSTLGGWQQQFNTLYPSKRVIVFSEKDLEKSNRQKILAQIATGTWDAVVVPHSSFQLIPVGDDIFNEHYKRLAAQLDEAIDLAESENMGSRFVKRLAGQKERLLVGLQKRRGKTTKDQTVTWEQLGIDHLVVDEAHEYKRLGFVTKQSNIAGIDAQGNQKTFDLLMKVRYTQKHGRGVVFASGTPVTNTLGELYNAMQYLIQGELDSRCLGRFDEWAASFGRVVDVFEPKPEGGGYQTKARFSKFVNVPELSQLVRSFADILTPDMLNIPRPELASGERLGVSNELSETQRNFMNSLQQRAKAVRESPARALPDNMLAIYTDAQKMSLDVRMVWPKASEASDSRLNQASREVHRLWSESKTIIGTQLIFMDFGKPSETKRVGIGRDEFSAYDELIGKLISAGVPAEEIAHIYQAQNKAQRSELFRRVNAGRIRVLLGSTGKMGIGVNVQERVIGLHHLTLPHRPSDLEQREGRGLRQGNRNTEVHVKYYITKGSLDELKFANVARKARAFAQFMQGKSTVREMEDIDDLTPSLEAFQAAASGDPRVLRKLEVDTEILRLSTLHSSWKDEQWTRRRELANYGRVMEFAATKIDAYRELMKARNEIGRVWSIKDARFEGKGIQEQVSTAIEPILNALQKEKSDQMYVIGSAFGSAVCGNHRGLRIGSGKYRPVIEFNGSGADGMIRKVENLMSRLENDIALEEQVIAKMQRSEAEERRVLALPWALQAQLDAFIKEQQQLFEALGGSKGDRAAMTGTEELIDLQVEAEESDAEEEGIAGESGAESEVATPSKPTTPAVKQDTRTAGWGWVSSTTAHTMSSWKPNVPVGTINTNSARTDNNSLHS